VYGTSLTSALLSERQASKNRGTNKIKSKRFMQKSPSTVVVNSIWDSLPEQADQFN